MKPTFLILAVVAQVAAGSVASQTTDTATTETTTATSTTTFGKDWTSTMGTAMMVDDGKTVRSASELATQFGTLSDADKDMLRRDCMVYMQTTGAAETTLAPDAALGTTETDGAVAGDTAATTGAAGELGLSLTAEQMDQICAATKDK